MDCRRDESGVSPFNAVESDVYRLVVLGMRDVPYAMTVEGILTYVGPQAETYGLSPDRMKGTSFLEYIAPEDRERLVSEFATTMGTGEEFVSTFRIGDGRGGIAWLEDIGHVQRDTEGNIVGITGVLRDVTERKKTEQMLDGKRAELSRLEAIVTEGPAVVFLWRFDPGFPVEYVSANVAQFGYSPEALYTGRVTWPGITHPDDEPRLQAEVSSFLAEGRDSFSQVYRLRNSAGAYRWIQDWNRVIRDREGEITHIQGVILDITERKRTEEALQESEENFRALADNADEAIVIEGETGFVYTNPYTASLTGYAAEELSELVPGEIIAPSQRARVADLTRRRLIGEPVSSRYESLIDRKDGEKVPVEVTAARTVWHGRPATIGMFRDITARKEAEAAFRRSEEVLARAQEMAGIGSWEWDPESGRVEWSREMFRLHGLEPCDGPLAAKQLGQYVHPDDRQRLSEVIMQAVNAGGHFSLEFRIVRADGTERVFLGQGEALQGEGGRKLVGVCLDITERRRLEREIIEIGQAEQRRIGHDIHDSLGQELAGISFSVKALEKRLAVNSPELAAEVSILGELASRSLLQAWHLAHGLSPVGMVEEGLAMELSAWRKRPGISTESGVSVSSSRPAWCTTIRPRRNSTTSRRKR